MTTKVIPMGLPSKSPRNKPKKAPPNLEEEIVKYGFELRQQKTPRETVDTPSIVREKNLEKKEVTCGSDSRQWVDRLLEYDENCYDVEESEKVSTVNCEGVSGWELAVPNPTLIRKVRRSKHRPPSRDDPIHEPPQVSRSKEYEFVDAPAWRICVDPTSYAYIPNNGRYRASKLVKKLDPQRHTHTLRKYHESRMMAPEKQHLQREIQRELRTEFELYLQQEKEQERERGEDKEVEESITTPQLHVTSAEETEHSKVEETMDMGEGDSDSEQYEPKAWRDAKSSHGKPKSSRKARIEGPASVLKVSTGSKRGKPKTKLFPPLDRGEPGLTGDQFLQEVSSKLLSWENERKGLPRTLHVASSVETITSSHPASSRDHRSRSEPPTITEIIDRHHSRSGYAELPQANVNSSLQNFSVHFAKSPINEEQIRYRLPKQRTDNPSLQRHVSQNSAPVERLSIQNGALVEGLSIRESTMHSQSSEYLAKLPPRGESLSIRTPLKALQSGTKTPLSGAKTPLSGTKTPISGTKTPIAGAKRPLSGTKTPLSGAVFSVRKLSNASSGSDSPQQTAWNRRPSWDYDDHAIDIVSKHQGLEPTVPSPQSQQRTRPLTQSNGAKQSTPNANPLSAITIVNQVKYTPETRSRSNKPHMAQSNNELMDRENSLRDHPVREESLREHYTDPMTSVPLQPLKMLITATKVNTSIPKKSGKTGLAKNMEKPKKQDSGKEKNDHGSVFEADCSGIGVSGKKMSYQEATQRII